MHGLFSSSLPLLVVMGLLAEPNLTAAEDIDSRIDSWLEKVSKNYSEEGWIEKPKFRPHGYMRPTGDKGWQLRMLALHAALRQGESSIPNLVHALESGDDAQRVFAAQTLGYFGTHAPAEPLLNAARKDKSAAVRLYAVDSLGMRGNSAGSVDWEALRKRERDRDVLKHIGYAEIRKNAAVDDAVVDRLTTWNTKAINSAAINKLAPDFELYSANRKKVRLSSFRGKTSVVLVFVYGDT